MNTHKLVLFFLGVLVQSGFAFSAEYCPFCDPAVLARQTFYEDDLVCALYTHKPVVPGHCLVMPKRHVERFELLTDGEILQIEEVIKKVNLAVMQVFETSAYLLLQKNGVEVGQSVPHIHFHYVPRKAGDTSMLSFLIKVGIAYLKPPISAEEMAEIVGKLKAACDTSGSRSVMDSD